MHLYTLAFTFTLYMVQFQLDIHTLDGVQLQLENSSVQSTEVGVHVCVGTCTCTYAWVINV